MKHITILLALSLIACGGESHKEDWEIDVELCEAQDGLAEVNHITDPITGEYHIEVGCLAIGEPVYIGGDE